MEIIVTIIVLLLLGGIAVAAFLMISRNVQTFLLVEYERIAVFRITGEFVGIRGPGQVRISRRSLLFSPAEQVRDQMGQIVDDPTRSASRFA